METIQCLQSFYYTVWFPDIIRMNHLFQQGMFTTYREMGQVSERTQLYDYDTLLGIIVSNKAIHE